MALLAFTNSFLWLTSWAVSFFSLANSLVSLANCFSELANSFVSLANCFSELANSFESLANCWFMTHPLVDLQPVLKPHAKLELRVHLKFPWNPCLFLSSFRLRLRHHFRLFFRQFISSDMMIFQIDMVQRKGERLPVLYPCPLLPPYCCGAVLWSNGPTSLIYHQHLLNIATSQQALCSEPCIAI